MTRIEQKAATLAPPEAMQERQRTMEAHAICRADWGDEANVRHNIREVQALESEGAFVAQYLRSVVRVMVGRWAPQNLGLLPPSWLQEGANADHRA